VQQVYLWYIVVVQIESLVQRIVTNKRFILLILNNFVSQNLEVGLSVDALADVGIAEVMRRPLVSTNVTLRRREAERRS
jgi:hypothetical protein